MSERSLAFPSNKLVRHSGVVELTCLQLTGSGSVSHCLNVTAAAAAARSRVNKGTGSDRSFVRSFDAHCVGVVVGFCIDFA